MKHSTPSPRLHLLGLPHTVTHPRYSHCAFTGKVQRFSPMMRAQGYEVFHYGNAGSESGASIEIPILSQPELTALAGRTFDPTSSEFIGDAAHVGSALYQEFNQRVRCALMERVAPGDIVCLPFGHAHQEAVTGLSDVFLVETGVGYPTCFAPFRIFESQAWYHWHCGADQRNGNDYHWVIPNYYDLSEWTIERRPGSYALYFGRLSDDKGLRIVVEIARSRPDVRFILCGQGNPAPYLEAAPNLEYQAPIFGRQRDVLLGGAFAVLMPTRYVEPFGGVAVEAQLCGTPVLCSSFGSFTETVHHGLSGFRCHTLGDWLAALEHVERWGPVERAAIAMEARPKYDMLELGRAYAHAFEQISDLRRAGWYTLSSPLGPITRAVPLV